MHFFFVYEILRLYLTAFFIYSIFKDVKIEDNFRSFASFGIVRASLELKPNVTKEAREFFVSLLDSDGFNSPDELREDAFAKCKGDIRRMHATERMHFTFIFTVHCAGLLST